MANNINNIILLIVATILIFSTLIKPNIGVHLPTVTTKTEQSLQNANTLEDKMIMYQQQQQHQQQQQQGEQQHKTSARAHEQIHHKSYDKNDDVDNRLLLPDEHIVWYNNNNNNDNSNTTNNNNNETSTKAVAASNNLHEHQRQRRELSDWLIAPNTRWCGRGNTANGTYNHLGGASAADKCCRKHDHCQVYIPGMSNRYNLFNYRPYTLSHCHCDRRFRTCLKMANDADANTIGKVFFNMVQTQCFILKHEKVCRKRSEDGSCAHEVNKRKAYLRRNKRY